MAESKTFSPLSLLEVCRMGRPGVHPENNPDVVKSVPDSISGMRKMAEEHLKGRPLGPDTRLSEHKILNFIFEKAARAVIDDSAAISDEGEFGRGVNNVIRRGGDNIGPAGYECHIESMDELLDFLEFRKFLYSEFDNRPDLAVLLAHKKEYIDFVLDRIPRRDSARILDLGCGYGTFAYHLARPGAEVVGIDYSFSRVEIIDPLFARMGERGRVEIRWGDATRILYPEDYFDQVVSADLIEHMGPEEQFKSLTEIRRILRPGGEWFIATPNLTYLQFTTVARKAALLLKGPIADRIRRFLEEKIPYTPGAAVGHGQHIGLLSAASLIRLAEKAGLEPAGAYFYMRGDVPSRIPGVFRPLVKLPLARKILSSWILVSGVKP